jgi:putative endonuclease
MQEVGGSIPPGSTTLRPSGYAWRSHVMAEGRSVPGVARLGEDGLAERCLPLNSHVYSAGPSRAPMWYVYIIRSISSPEQEYIGATADLKRRLPEHNAGKSTHTAKFKPWELVWYCAFPDKYKALEFEKYLKSHSGRAFAKKRF